MDGVIKQRVMNWGKGIAVIAAVILAALPTQAASAKDCWYDYMVHQMSFCTHDQTKCIQSCASIPKQDARLACFNSCGAAADACRKNCSAAYTACINAGSGAQQKTKELIIQDLPQQPETNLNATGAGGAQGQVNAVETLGAVNLTEQPKETAVSGPSEVIRDTPIKVESQLDTLKNTLEWLRDASQIYLDAKDLRDYLSEGKFGDYGGISLATDVGNAFCDFLDLLAKGVSVEDASSKAIIDTTATSLLCLFPPLKAAEIIASMPDKVLSVLGLSEDGLARSATGFLSGNSPGAFVKKSTDAMVTAQNWTNMAGSLKMGVDDIRSAEGFVETVKETGNLVGTAIGAIPVSAAMIIRDDIATVISAGKGVFNYISDWLTY